MRMTRWYQIAMWSLLRRLKLKRWISEYNIACNFHDCPPDEPFVLVGNHAHRLDPYFAGAFSGARVIHYMANIDGVGKLQQRLAHLVAAYSKKKGMPDLQAVRHTFALVKAGSSVGIFPEGDRSWDGETAAIHPSTAALIRKLRVPIWVAHFRGHYLSWPRWADYPARGSLIIDFSVIPVETSQAMTAAELQEELSRRLYQNDVKDEQLQQTEFVCDNRAAGIQRVVWLCPVCRAHDSMQTLSSGDRFACGRCGHEWHIDGNLRITPSTGESLEDLKDWLDRQSEEAHRLLSPDAIPETTGEPTRTGEVFQTGATSRTCVGPDTRGCITSTEGVKVLERKKRKVRGKMRERLVPIGEGSLRLYSDSIELTGEHSELLRRFSPITEIEGFIDNFNRYAEFQLAGSRYRLMFGGKSSYKWIQLVSALRSGSARPVNAG